jgi:thiamine monophosphate synthase
MTKHWPENVETLCNKHGVFLRVKDKKNPGFADGVHIGPTVSMTREEALELMAGLGSTIRRHDEMKRMNIDVDC